MAKNYYNHPLYKQNRPLVIERDGQCVQCGSTTQLEADHITPIAVGLAQGLSIEELHSMTNLQTLCKICNGTKQDNVLSRINWYDEEWLDSLV